MALTKIRLSNLTQPLDQDLSVPNLTASGSITTAGVTSNSAITVENGINRTQLLFNDLDFHRNYAGAGADGAAYINFYDGATSLQITDRTANTTVAIAGFSQASTFIYGNSTDSSNYGLRLRNTASTNNLTHVIGVGYPGYYDDSLVFRVGNNIPLYINGSTGVTSFLTDVNMASGKFIGSASGNGSRLDLWNTSEGANNTLLIATNDLVLRSSDKIRFDNYLSIDHTNPRIDFVGDDTIVYRIVVDESTNKLTLGHSTNRALFLGNDGNASFAYNLGVDGNLTVTGDLTINGNTTSVSTNNLDVEDAVITLNSGQATPFNTTGLLMQRYATANSTNWNVFTGFDETDDRYKIVTTDFDGSPSSNTQVLHEFGMSVTLPTAYTRIKGSDPDLVQDLTAGPDGTYVASAIQHIFMKDGVTLGEIRMESSNGELTIRNTSSSATANTHTGKVHLSTNGNRLTVLRTGEIGIGDVDPYSKLTVVTGHKDATASIDNGNVVSIQSDTGNLVQKLNLGVDTTLGSAFIQSVTPGTSPRSLLLNPNGGFVGIRKTNPIYNLDVNSNARVGGSQDTAATLIVEASNTAGSSSYTTAINLIGYEGRGKGIFLNDVDTPAASQTWFAGVPYNSSHKKYQIGLHNSQPEYIDSSVILLHADNATGSGSVLIGDKNSIKTGDTIDTGWNFDHTKLDVRGRLAGGRVHNTDVFTKDLMLYLDFNNIHCYSPEIASNGRVNDLSKNNHQVVPTGNAVYTTDNGIMIANFDGNGDYLLVNEFNNTDETISFEAWFKIDTWASGGSNWNTIFDLCDSDLVPTESPLLGVLYDGVSAGILRAYPSNVNFASDIQLGRWYHVVWAFNGNNDLDVYLNGELLGSGINWGGTMMTTSTATTGSTLLRIGGDTGAETLDGKIAIARVYDKQLTGDEVRRNYNADALRFGHGGFVHDNTLYLAQDGSPTIINKGDKEFNIYAEDGIAFKVSGIYTFPLIQGDGSGNLELIANARPANTGQKHHVAIKAGTSGGGGPSEIARFIEGDYGVGKMQLNYVNETPYSLYVYQHTADKFGNAVPQGTLGLAAWANQANEGPSIDFYNIWNDGAIYHPSDANTGWCTSRIASVYDATNSNGGALTFYTTSGASSQSGANYANLTERLRIDPNGRLIVADSGLIRLGDVALSLPKQSFSYSVSAGAADQWYKLCEVDNPWKGEIQYFVGCNNAEEHGTIKIKTTWTVSNLQLEVDRQTYNPMLKEVRLSAASSGGNYEIWVRLHSDSAQLVSNPTFRYQITNAFVYSGGSSYFATGGVVSYSNTSGTPATNRTSAVLDGTAGIGAQFYNGKTFKGSQIIDVDSGAVAQTLLTTSDIALRLHGKNTWTGIQFVDNTDTGTGASMNMFYNGSTTGGTLAIGGGGANAANKILHVHGGLTVGQNLNNTATATGNDAIIQGKLGVGLTTAPSMALEVNAQNSYASGASGILFKDGGTSTTISTAATFRVSNNGTSPQYAIAEFESTSGSTVFYNDGHVVFSGDIYAASKSFDIEHPTKEGMRLHHGSLEGPEHGVYVRGRLKDSNVIVLPDYWTGLVHEDTITVQLTAIGGKQDLWIEDIIDNTIIVGCEAPVNCFYFVQAERKDVDRFDVEYEAE